MPRLAPWTAIVLLVAASTAGAQDTRGQGAERTGEGQEREPPTEWSETVRGQVGLAFGPIGYQGELSVAVRVAGPWSVGGGVGFRLEEPLQELDTRVLELWHADAFVRHQDMEEIFVDLGITAGGFVREDDLSGDCSHATCGWLAGLYVAPSVGYRYVFASLRLRVVLVDDLGDNRIAYILTPLLRSVISW